MRKRMQPWLGAGLFGSEAGMRTCEPASGLVACDSRVRSHVSSWSIPLLRADAQR